MEALEVLTPEVGARPVCAAALCAYDDETITPHEITVEGEEVLSE